MQEPRNRPYTPFNIKFRFAFTQCVMPMPFPFTFLLLLLLLNAAFLTLPTLKFILLPTNSFAPQDCSDVLYFGHQRTFKHLLQVLLSVEVRTEACIYPPQFTCCLLASLHS